jgi:Ca2+-binding EF-hand superfamily protein
MIEGVNVNMTAYRILLLTAWMVAASAPMSGARAQGAGGPPPGVDRPSAGASGAGDPLMRSAQMWDANHDGVLTCDEWKQYAARTFNAADINRDGHLVAAEFTTLKQSSPTFAQADLGYFDDNRDGRLSRMEFVDKKSPLFARYDRNNDCRLTADEMRGGRPASEGGTGVRPTLGPGGMGGKVDF